ncbi:MAG: putative addiction module component [Verrucomicrobiota bacterium]
MPATLDAVAHDALILPPNQRLALVRQLLDSVDLEPEPGAEAAWEAEIVRRIARFEAGESQPVSAGEVFARLRQLAPGR